MIEPTRDRTIEEIASEARRPVLLDGGAKARLLAAIREEPLPERPRRGLAWLLDRQLMLSPVGSFAMAAGLVGFGLLIGLRAHHNSVGAVAVTTPTVASAQTSQTPHTSDTVVERTFVILAPQAARVSVVGDFNQWSATATPMVRARGSGLWTVTLPLESGRHVYSFVVDGQWALDPSAPVAPDDGFGHSSSVIVVSKGSAL